ncbi:MAG TPA: hypothetical protein VJY54_07325 [Lachnospiraceae bacterium]|nr:hypothetical protein [Lachnospiraceae bacterium]
MKPKLKKMIIAIIAIVVMVLILDSSNAWFGNPISKAIAKKTAEKYIDENYGDLNLVLQEAGYNFKFSHYYVRFQSTDSIDTTFTVHVNSYGKVLDDDYQYEVANNFRTLRRYESELREIGDKLFRAQLNYNISNALLLLEKVSDEDMLKLTKDMPFDIQNMPSEINASITIIDEDISYGKMSEVLINMAEVCKKENIPIATFSVRIEKEKDEAEKRSYVNVYHIPADILNSANIPKALEELDAE